MAAAIASTQRNEPRPAWLADMLSDVNMREDCRDSLTLAELQAALSIGPSSAMSLAKKNVASGLWRETTKRMPSGHYARAWCKINRGV